jgi:glycosyltransferase involved in cell wall biosynthesis
MKLVFFTFYFPPDLSAGSFRSIALAKSLSNKLNLGDEIHIITTHPNRYNSYLLEAQNTEVDGLIKIHRISVPFHKNGMISQSYTFLNYAFKAFIVCKKIKPDFLIGTSSRLMTALLTWISSKILKKNYFIDLRDIFSESISDIFAQKNNIVGSFLQSIFIFLEKQILKSASGVNIVSKGFPEYFENLGLDTSNWLFFPNGIDKEFQDFSSKKDVLKTEVKTILYAGNIGTGQGLDKVIPSILQKIDSNYKFQVIGDGGRIAKLKNIIQQQNISNIEFISPVGREELLKFYMQADILFLHLNNIPAYSRVLPSKIFEYGALGIPIVAGLRGYSKQFLKENISYAFFFEPGDSDGANKAILKATGYKVPKDEVTVFVKQYSRELIMSEMAKKIIDLALKK